MKKVNIAKYPAIKPGQKEITEVNVLGISVQFWPDEMSAPKLEKFGGGIKRVSFGPVKVEF